MWNGRRRLDGLTGLRCALGFWGGRPHAQHTTRFGQPWHTCAPLLQVFNFKSYRGQQKIGPFKSFTAVVGGGGGLQDTSLMQAPVPCCCPLLSMLLPASASA